MCLKAEIVYLAGSRGLRLPGSRRTNDELLSASAVSSDSESTLYISQFALQPALLPALRSISQTALRAPPGQASSMRYLLRRSCELQTL
jgi:hypothetical protein